MKRNIVAWVLLSCALTACTSIGIGVNLPIGGIGSVGVGVSSDGRVSGGVSVGRGGVSVGVGGSGQLPSSKPKGEAGAAAAAEPAASAAAASASAPTSNRP